MGSIAVSMAGLFMVIDSVCWFLYFVLMRMSLGADFSGAGDGGSLQLNAPNTSRDISGGGAMEINRAPVSVDTSK